MNNYKETGLKLINSLASTMTNDGLIIDPVTNKQTPLDHYCYTHLAVAAMHGYRSTSKEKYAGISKKCIDQYLSIPEHKRGHREFNLYALCEFIDICPPDFSEYRNRVVNHIENMELSDINEIPRNWLALKTNSIKLAESNGIAFDQNPHQLLDEWKTWIECDGLFVDSNSEHSIETPLTYHSMHTALMLEYADRWDDSGALEVGLQALDRICDFVLSDGETLYWGRSSNTLFGYMHLLYAIELGINNGRENLNKYRALVRSYIQELKTDDEFSLTPGSTIREPVGWDGYMYHTVYNANAAYILLKIRNNNPNCAQNINLQDSDRSDFLIKKTNPQVAIHKSGQTKFGKRDPRCFGFVPLAFKSSGGEDIISAPPTKPTPTTSPLNFVPLSPFLPVVVCEGKPQTPIYWRNTNSRVVSDNIHHVTGSGIFSKNPSRLGTELYSKFSSLDNLSSLMSKLGAGKLLDYLRKPTDPSMEIKRNILTGEINGKGIFIVSDSLKTDSTADRWFPYSFPLRNNDNINVQDNELSSRNWSAILDSSPIDRKKFCEYETNKGKIDIELFESKVFDKTKLNSSFIFSGEEIECEIEKNNQGFVFYFDSKKFVVEDGRIQIY